jgi:hypothetical protein
VTAAKSASSPLDGLVLRVDSEVLGERVLFVGDDFKPEPEYPIAYTADELYRLLDAPPDMIRAVHRIKKSFFGARVVMQSEEVKP